MWNFIATSNYIGKIVKLAFIISSGTFWGQSNLNEKLFRFPPSLDFEQKTLGRVVTSASQASRGTICWRTAFWNDLLFFNSVEWLLVEFRTAIYVSKRTFLATLFWIIILLFSFADFEQNNCENFSEMLSAIFKKWILCVQKNKLTKKLFPGKCRFYSSFPDFERWLNVTFGNKRFRGACQKCLSRVQRNFLEKPILWKLLYKQLVSIIEQKTFGRMVNKPLRVQWNVKQW